MYVNTSTLPIDTIAHALLYLDSFCKANDVRLIKTQSYTPNQLNFIFDGTFLSDTDIENLKHNKVRIGLILTERLSLQNDNLSYNGNAWNKKSSGRIDPYTNTKRLFQLLKLVPLCEYLVILGDVFDAGELGRIFPSTRMLQFPFPIIQESMDHGRLANFGYVISFPGGRVDSDYRRWVISQMKEAGCEIEIFFESDLDKYGQRVSNGRVNLHIPKNGSWQYSSPLRTFASIVFGVQPGIFLDGNQVKTFAEIDRMQLKVNLENCTHLPKEALSGSELIRDYNRLVTNQQNERLTRDVLTALN
jgi:hypothetical protein